jgi:hypothetical protein
MRWGVSVRWSKPGHAQALCRKRFFFQGRNVVLAAALKNMFTESVTAYCSKGS